MLKTLLKYFISNLCIEILFNRVSNKFPLSMNIKVGDKFSYIHFLNGDKQSYALEHIYTNITITHVIHLPNNTLIYFTYEICKHMSYVNNKINYQSYLSDGVKNLDSNYISYIIETRL